MMAIYTKNTLNWFRKQQNAKYVIIAFIFLPDIKRDF